MRTIQEVGSEILNNQPKSFYVFGGSEYGIKKKYLSMLKNHYEGRAVEINSMTEMVSMMSTKHIIPLQPSLYICRYDEAFINMLTEVVAAKIKALKIVGTVVCLYENEKHIAKIDKYLPDYVVRIDDVNIQFKIKYLHSDFPHLPDRLINLAAQSAANYGDAQNMCACMTVVAPEELFSLSDKELAKLFGKSEDSTEDAIKQGIASRNFTHLIKLLDIYPDLDNLYYTILATMIELDKVTTNSYVTSPLREYAKRWTKEDIYNMFMNTYSELMKSRTYNVDIENSLIYLFSLLKFQVVPDVDAMGGET